MSCGPEMLREHIRKQEQEYIKCVQELDEAKADVREWRDSYLGMVQERDTAIAEAVIFRDAADAFDGLCVCYRVGARPTEKLHRRLAKARKAMNNTTLAADHMARDEAVEAAAQAIIDAFGPIEKSIFPDNLGWAYAPSANMVKAELIVTLQGALARRALGEEKSE